MLVDYKIRFSVVIVAAAVLSIKYEVKERKISAGSIKEK